MRGDRRSADRPDGGESPARRARRWPSRGQIGIAVGIGVVAAIGIGILAGPKSSKHAGTTVVTVAPPTTDSPATTPTTKRTPPTTTSTQTSTTRRATTTTTTARTATTTVAAPTGPQLLPLTIATASHQDTYDRAADFGGWIHVDGCKNTRAVLLIARSQVPVTYTTARDCTVKTGRWVDPWSGVVATKASSFQIDHTVPLGNAWRSGAWSWTHAQRVTYANDLTDADHLVPILAHENESKSDDGPEAWRPPDHAAWCRYALDWDRIKAKWHLTATTSEWAAVVEMYATC